MQGVQTQTLSARRVPTANDPAQSLSCDRWISKFNVHVIFQSKSSWREVCGPKLLFQGVLGIHVQLYLNVRLSTCGNKYTVSNVIEEGRGRNCNPAATREHHPRQFIHVWCYIMGVRALLQRMQGQPLRTRLLAVASMNSRNESQDLMISNLSKLHYLDSLISTDHIQWGRWFGSLEFTLTSSILKRPNQTRLVKPVASVSDFHCTQRRQGQKTPGVFPAISHFPWQGFCTAPLTSKPYSSSHHTSTSPSVQRLVDQLAD